MELEQHLYRAVVRVESKGRIGAGFFVAPGLIVTAAHLVEDPSSGDFPLSEVDVSSGEWRTTARVVRYASAPDPDLAIVEVDQASSAIAYMYAPYEPGDGLSICGLSQDDAPLTLPLEALTSAGYVLDFGSPVPTLLEGSPVLNLRTGGVTAVLTRGSSPSDGAVAAPSVSGTSVSVVARLFPDVFVRHDQHHAASPDWFAATGVRGTVFAAREHILATRDTCETPIQPLITPANERRPMDLLAPVAFQPPSLRLAAGRGGLQTSIEDVLDRSWDLGRSLLLTGPTGSGRSSVLRAVGYRASKRFGNLGTLGQDCLFPILLRANQLATDGGSVEAAIIRSMERGNEVMTGLDLPPTFLTDLARSPGIRLLLMIDGMDEIQNSRDISAVVGFVGKIHEAPGFGPHTQLLVTARPAAAEHFRYAPFDVCEIQPLGESSIRTAAEHWLESEAQSFLDANDGLVRSGLLSSPLVLAVALKLYESEPRALPAQVVELYRSLISSLAVHRRAELAGKYGSEVADNAVELLGFVALELLRSATVMDEVWVRSTASRYFEDQLGLDREKAHAHAESFTHFAAADSHFIGPAGSRFFWSHLSFRDYFAASSLVNLNSSDGGAVREIRQRWFDSSWGRTPSFALQLLEDDAARLDIIREVMASGRDARFAFMTDLIREGAPLGPNIVSEFVGQLAAKVRQEKEEGLDGEGDPVTFDLLLSLAHMPQARDVLEELGAGTVKS